MKKMRSIAVVAGSILIASNVLGLLAGCSDNRNVEKVDHTKTQFHIGNFDGGYGHAWIEKAADLFEERYAEKEFESGKKGVQIWINNAKDEYSEYIFYQTIAGLPQDFFVAPIPRAEITDNKLLISLNDIIDEPMTEFGEEKTIREKLSDYYKEAYQFDKLATATAEGEALYYLPTAEAFFGNIVYDVDLFETKGYFISKDGGWTKGENKSVGMDGIAGTYDDGLPTTEEEFFALVEYIALVGGDVPLTWAGKYPAYMNAFVANMFLNYDDGVGMKIYNTLEGEYVIPGDAEATVFNGYNFYDAQRHPGRLAALKATEKLIKDGETYGYYSSDAFKDTQTHTKAQNEFLISAKNESRIAMLIEGAWWESEATETFSLMSNRYDAKYSKKNRKLGVMPTFRVNGSVGEKSNFLTSNQALFINGNTSHVELAKTFMKFLLSNEIRELFTDVTGVPSPYDYQLSPTTYNNLSNFGKNLWEIHENKNGMFHNVTEMRTSKAYHENRSAYPQSFQTLVGKVKTTCPFTAFKFDGLTAQTYYDGIISYANKQYDDNYATKHGARA